MAENDEDTTTRKSSKALETTGEHVGYEKATEVGWWGSRNTDHPDAAYSLETGPESPTGERGAE